MRRVATAPRASSDTSGGDDFVAVVDPEAAEHVAKRIASGSTEARPDFYEPEDLERGFVRMEDRKGVMQDIPLVAVSVGIASTAKRQFAHYGEAVAVATEMKSFAKRAARLELRRRPPRRVARPSGYARRRDPPYTRGRSLFPGRGAIPHRR